MRSPFTGGTTTLLKEKRALEFRKEALEVVYHYYKCDDSGEQFTTEANDLVNTNQVYNQYRVKYGIPFPEEIKSIREQYALPATKMSEILGFGINVYRQYEAGEMPSVSNGRLIQIAKDPKEFRRLVEYSRHEFSSQELKRIMAKIDAYETSINARDLFEERVMLGPKTPDIFNGFRSPEIIRIEQIILFFSERLQPFKTKMNKLLFYADFIHFRKTCFSISGLQYQALPKGPVPKNYDWIFNHALERNIVKIEMSDFGEFIGEQYYPAPASQFNKELFSEEEINTLNGVANKFKKMNVSQIVTHSHKEKAWLENIDGYGVISYEYGWGMI